MVNLVNSLSLLRIALLKRPKFASFLNPSPRNYFLRVHTTGDHSQGLVAGTSPLVCADLKTAPWESCSLKLSNKEGQFLFLLFKSVSSLKAELIRQIIDHRKEILKADVLGVRM